jgi:hypothetical protein
MPEAMAMTMTMTVPVSMAVMMMAMAVTMGMAVVMARRGSTLMMGHSGFLSNSPLMAKRLATK